MTCLKAVSQLISIIWGTTKLNQQHLPLPVVGVGSTWTHHPIHWLIEIVGASFMVSLMTLMQVYHFTKKLIFSGFRGTQPSVISQPLISRPGEQAPAAFGTDAGVDHWFTTANPDYVSAPCEAQIPHKSQLESARVQLFTGIPSSASHVLQRPNDNGPRKKRMDFDSSNMKPSGACTRCKRLKVRRSVVRITADVNQDLDEVQFPRFPCYLCKVSCRWPRMRRVGS